MNFMIFNKRGFFLFLRISFISLYSFRNNKKRKIFLPFEMLSSIDFARFTERICFDLYRRHMTAVYLLDKVGKLIGVLHASDV